MRVENLRIYGFEEALEDAGLPMSNKPFAEVSIERGRRLANADGGSGHDSFLKGIIVRARVTASHNFWLQFLRYHFQDSLSDIVSSQSKMHRITQFNIDSMCNKYVASGVIDIMKSLIDRYKHEDLDKKERETLEKKILYSCPCGLELTAGIVTNFLQIKTMIFQRQNHKLDEWREFFIPITTTQEWKCLFPSYRH